MSKVQRLSRKGVGCKRLTSEKEGILTGKAEDEDIVYASWKHEDINN